MVKKTFGNTDIHKKTMEIVKRSAEGKDKLSFIIASGNLPELTEWYARETSENFKPKELIVTGISPVIGVHVGPDAAGIAFL